MTTPPLPLEVRSTWDALQTALLARQPLHIRYHGLTRLVCPHALGWHNHRALLLAYQTGGQTSTGTLHPDPTKRWRCLHIDQIDNLTPADHTKPWQSAANYNPRHPFPTNIELVVAIGTTTRPAAS
jgi:predicted DNA-binding transcriptional regulator YafY